MPCTKCGSQDHSRDNCRWPGVLLVVFSILFLIVGPAIALEATMARWSAKGIRWRYACCWPWKRLCGPERCWG